LLPPFINPELALAPQLSALVFIILCSEFICMMIYASGGKTIGKLLTEQNNVQKLNKISGGLMGGVAVWLAVS
jgi:threonine/homoserine/homoserine lactone efflux protein